MGTSIDLNTESFVFLDSSRLKTTEWCKAHICKKQPINFASSDRNTLISSAELVHPVHVNCEKGTKHTLSKDQHPHEMALIVFHLYKHKL